MCRDQLPNILSFFINQNINQNREEALDVEIFCSEVSVADLSTMGYSSTDNNIDMEMDNKTIQRMDLRMERGNNLYYLPAAKVMDRIEDSSKNPSLGTMRINNIMIWKSFGDAQNA